MSPADADRLAAAVREVLREHRWAWRVYKCHCGASVHGWLAWTAHVAAEIATRLGAAQEAE